MPSSEIRLIYLRVLKVIDEPLGQSNTERSVKVFIYYQMPFSEILLKYLRVLKVFDEPLGESNTERSVKVFIYY